MKIVLLSSALFIVGALGWRLTFANATWHIHRVFPTARVYFDPVGSPDYTYSALLTRLIVRDYFERDEYIGFELSDYPTPIDFSRVSGFHLHSVRLTRCKVSDMRALISIGTFVTFDDCDLSSLPPEQRRAVWCPSPNAPNAERHLALNSP